MTLYYSQNHIAPAILTLWIFLSLAPAYGDNTLSPYFQVAGESVAGSENLPLQETSARVHIAGVIADVQIRQVYRNRGDTAIEALYVFPGSTRAAVNGMTMTVGERRITAKIQERKAAQTSYRLAKRQGKRASLLEQQRPNVFQMQVANIMPGDTVVVELSYSELIVPEEGVYEFVYPVVVGPRYSEMSAVDGGDGERWIANPYLHEDNAPPYAFDIDVSLSAGLPIQAVTSPSHTLQVAYDGEGNAKIGLDGTAGQGGDRDFILRYQLRGKQIETGLLLQRGEKENFFLLMAQPPERIATVAIPSREYIFVVDVSGSMHGFPLDTAKKLMVELLSGLRSSDTFNILFFSGGSSTLSERSLPVTDSNIKRAIGMLESRRGGGGTRLLPALRKAMALPPGEATSRSFVIVSDGYVSIETEAFQFVREHLHLANVFAFGIGSSVNRFLIEGLARAGRGEPFVVTSPDHALTTAQRFRHYIETPALTGIELKYDGFEVYDVVPLQVPDLFAERPLLVTGKWRGAAEGIISITGHRGDADYSAKIHVDDAKLSESNRALRDLWARQRIAELGDFEKLRPGAERQAQITNLGLTYNLLTAYTSFVAVDEVVVNKGGGNRRIKQPLPLPKGVSDLAVGGVVPTTPEPEMASLLGMLVLIFVPLTLCWLRRRGTDLSRA